MFPILHGLHWLTANLAEAARSCLTLDDTHWLDPETLRYLNYLAHRIPDLSVSAIVAERLGDPASPTCTELRGRCARNLTSACER